MYYFHFVNAGFGVIEFSFELNILQRNSYIILFAFLATFWRETVMTEGFTMTEMCRMRSSSLVESLAGSSVGSGRFRLPSWWWMWKSRVPFSSHCCLQRTRGMSSEFPEISARHNRKQKEFNEKLFVVAAHISSQHLPSWWKKPTDIYQKRETSRCRFKFNTFSKRFEVWKPHQLMILLVLIISSSWWTFLNEILLLTDSF